MEVGAESIGMVKTNTKVFCKETIDKLKNDWSGGSYLVLRSKPMVPRDMPLIDIGCKYNARKFLYFIVTDKAGITKTGIAYLYKYPDQFTNIAICPVVCPFVMSKTFLLLMRLTPTTNQDSLIWNCRIGGLLNVVG